MNEGHNNPLEYDFSKYTILIVDDDPSNLNVIFDDLKKYGFKIVAANDGQSALERLKFIKPDIILLDVLMQGIDGFETCSYLKSKKEYESIPVIFMTALTSTEDKVKGFKAGGVDYITKPFQHEEVFARISTHLHIRDLTQSLEENNSKLEEMTGKVLFVNKELENTIEELERALEDRSHVEKALIQSEEQYRRLIELSPDGIAVHTESEVIFSNPAMANMLGINHQEKLIGISIADFIHIHSQQIINERIDIIIREKRKMPLTEITLIKLDGSEKKIETEAISTFLIYQEKATVMTIFRDITDRKKIERLRDDTERIVRHDLKNPLTSIIASSMILQKSSLTDDDKKMLSYIYDSSHQMIHLINHSMDLFKMEEGSYEFKTESVDLIQLFNDLDNELSYLAKDKSINRNYYLHNKMINWKEAYYIAGERLYLKDLFSNLLHNALEASPENEIVSVFISDKNDYHRINIHNLGAIPEPIRDRFFERYVTKGKKRGTGLGTYSALLIAKTHGGNINFSTSDNKGTSLIVSLPKHKTFSLKP